MIKTELIMVDERQLRRTWSDAGFMIERDGAVYSEAAVRWVQWALNSRGYNCGKMDGIFGKGTKLAVMLAQKANGLVVDGIVGDKTKEVLR